MKYFKNITRFSFFNVSQKRARTLKPKADCGFGGSWCLGEDICRITYIMYSLTMT